MTNQTLDEFMADGKYLPDFMRDFHAQKLVFKVIGEMVERERNKPNNFVKDLPNWVMAHIYTIDFFLWFMAKRGYTLQRSRAKIDFKDIAVDFEDYHQRERQEFDKWLLSRKEKEQVQP